MSDTGGALLVGAGPGAGVPQGTGGGPMSDAGGALLIGADSGAGVPQEHRVRLSRKTLDLR
ncbi:hypothetical protein [Amycolatopsis taiwanensis]|uniref:hypothetical protein n=1 Tax=Amycolatopsis taiwanensis TaxID=342230 RepID=UPI0012EB0E6D|nr:hypothetical protein [Amycolatopsis taiwanensis]